MVTILDYNYYHNYQQQQTILSYPGIKKKLKMTNKRFSS